MARGHDGSGTPIRFLRLGWNANRGKAPGPEQSGEVPEAAARPPCFAPGRSGGDTPGAETGHRYRHVGTSGGKFHALADEPGLRRLAAPLEAVEQPAHRPQIVRMDLRSGQRAAKSKVLAIDDF